MSRLSWILTGLSVLACSGVIFAGELDPPPGAVAPTPGPEPRTPINAINTPGDADSVYKITTPGSYYLTEDVVGVTGKHGIEIAAHNVAIDLMGFEVRGVDTAVNGIVCSVGGLQSLEVRNGVATGWYIGVDLGTNVPIGGMVEKLRANDNAFAGIVVGTRFMVRECSSIENDGSGILCGAVTTISDCNTSQNAGIGISIGSSSVAEFCTANLNGGVGFLVTGASRIEACSATANAADGISASSDCLILNNLCDGNGTTDGAGIYLSNGDNRVEGNNCTDNPRGIEASASGSIILRNTCAGNGINFKLVANNVYGQIVDRTAPASAAVSGNAAVSTLGTTDPNANFSY